MEKCLSLTQLLSIEFEQISKRLTQCTMMSEKSIEDLISFKKERIKDTEEQWQFQDKFKKLY